MCPLTHLLAQCTGGRYHGVMNSVEKYIAWRADSMRIRPHGLVTVLVLTMWACAGLMIWTCSCCALMGMTCPGLCTSSPSVLPTPSSHTSVPMYVVSVQPHYSMPHLLSRCLRLHRRLSPSPPRVIPSTDNRDAIRLGIPICVLYGLRASMP